MHKSAVFSPCRTYRYSLTRRWDDELPSIMFIGLNPSTADETEDDPTIRRCIDYAQRWGYGELIMTNLFAFRATDPSDLFAFAKENCNVPAIVMGPENLKYLTQTANEAAFIIAAWGNHGTFLDQDKRIIDLIPNLHCLKLNKSGTPAHPLYQRKDAKVIPYEGRA